MVVLKHARDSAERAGHPSASVGSLTLVVAVFAAATLPLAYVLNVWQDEAYSLHTTSANLPYALHEAISFEAQAPLYFLLLDVWRGISRTVFFARCFSIICAIGAIAVFWMIARRRLPLVKPIFPTVAFAMNPFVVWAALEIRLYAFALLLSALLTWTFCEGFLTTRPRRARVWYVLLATAALYTQYYLGVYLVAHFFVLLQRRMWRVASHYSLCAVVVAIAAAPLAAILPRQLSAFRGYPVSFNALRSAGVVAESVEFLLPRDWIPSWTHDWQLNLLYLALAVAVVALLLKRRHDREASEIFGVMTISIGLCFFAALFVMHQQLVVPRQAVALLIPSLLLTFALLGDPARGSFELSLIKGVYVAFSAASLAQTYLPPVKSGDWRHVADYLNGHLRSNDTVAAFNAEIVLPLTVYYAGHNRIVPIPRPLNLDASFDQRTFAIHSDGEIESSFAKAMPARGGHVWLITTDQSAKSAAYSGRGILENFVRRRFHVASSRQFDGTTVRELSL